MFGCMFDPTDALWKRQYIFSKINIKYFTSISIIICELKSATRDKFTITDR